MVFSGFGLDVSEEQLRRLCDCTSTFGTDALQAVMAARQLGFTGAAKYTLRFDELRTLVESGKHPIAFISLEPIGGKEESHAVVIVGASETTLTVYDPLHGERTLSRQSFDTAWAMRHNLVVLIER